MNRDVVARFTEKISIGDGCWDWVASTNSDGYGLFSKGSSRKAHQVSYELFVGPLPHGRICVLHRCNNRRCVRPSHLYLGTQKENARDRESAGTTFHQYGEDSPLSLLTEADVTKIRGLCAAGGMYQKDVAAMFGTTQGTVSKIQRRATWAWLQ